MERRKTGKIGLIRAPQSQQPWPKNRENPAVSVSSPGNGEITRRGDWRRERYWDQTLSVSMRNERRGFLMVDW